MKWHHEIRDPVHNFIRVTDHERRVINSAPVQRLRHVHQLAMAYLLYPGATHRRFEHSLGVMHLAGELFDRLTDSRRLTDEVTNVIGELDQRENMSYWRTVVRLAALCHDVGHLPFSHAAEHDLLAEGITHETLTRRVVMESEIADILRDLEVPIKPEVVAKIAIGPAKWDEDDPLTDWEVLLSDIITGDAFGVDRIDYLLRDSLHAGVRYGLFDHHRLLDTLRIIPEAQPDATDPESSLRAVIGIEEGGLHAAEALVIARYFMFSQVYMHPVRAAYDEHLIDFMRGYFGEHGYPGDVAGHLAQTDNEILSQLRELAVDGTEDTAGVRAARHIWRRDHFRVLYSETPDDRQEHLNPARSIYEAACEQYGEDNVKLVTRTIKSGSTDFSVLGNNGQIASADSFGRAFTPEPTTHKYVLIDSKLRDAAEAWMSQAGDTLF